MSNPAIQSSMNQLKRELLSAQLNTTDENHVDLMSRLLNIAQQAIDLRNQVQLAHYGEDHMVTYVVIPKG